jgi:hypothetical protein
MNFFPFFAFISVSLLVSASLQASQATVAEHIGSSSESQGFIHNLDQPCDEGGEHEKAEDVAPSVGMSIEINGELCDFSRICLLIDSTYGLIEITDLLNFLKSHREDFKRLLLYAAQRSSFISFSRLFRVAGAEELVAELQDENPAFHEHFERCRQNMMQASWGMSLEAQSGVGHIIVVRSELFRRNLPEASSAGEPDMMMNDFEAPGDDDEGEASSSQFETLNSEESEHETSDSEQSGCESSNSGEPENEPSISDDTESESLNSDAEDNGTSARNRPDEEASDASDWSESDDEESSISSESSESASGRDSDYEFLAEDYTGFNYEDSEQRNAIICYHLHSREPEDIEGLVPFLQSDIVVFMDLLVYAARHEDKVVIKKLFHVESVEFVIVLLFACSLKDSARRLASEISFISECFHEVASHNDDQPEPFYNIDIPRPEDIALREVECEREENS